MSEPFPRKGGGGIRILGKKNMKRFAIALGITLGALAFFSTCALFWPLPDPPTGGEFNVHFLGVTAGAAIIIDMDDKEIIIDGGLHPYALSRFVQETTIIQEPIELVVVTHPHIDHWYGLKRLLLDENVAFLEFWEPGYDPVEQEDHGYDEFISGIKEKVPEGKFLRPFPPIERAIFPYTVRRPSLPGVEFTVLHSSNRPDGHNDPYRRNNASIVLLVEIFGVKMLFPGDATGKCKPGEASCEQYALALGKQLGRKTGKRAEEKTCEDYMVECGDPIYVEEALLALEKTHPGLLKADILEVPHHGSETSSTPQFIQAVNPRYAIITATGPFLPKREVMRRYKACSDALILSTGTGSLWNTKHISCTGGDGECVCDYMENFSPNDS